MDKQVDIRERMIAYVEAEAAGVASLATPGQPGAEFIRAYARAYQWAGRELRRLRPVAEIVHLAELLADQQCFGPESEMLRGECMGYSQVAFELAQAHRNPELLDVWMRAGALELAGLRRGMYRMAAQPREVVPV